MRRILMCSLPLLVLLLGASRSEARLMIFTSGTTVKPIGEVVNKEGGQGLKNMPAGLGVGYCYNYAGLFWIEFWTWGGSYCLHEPNRRPIRISREQAAALLDRDAETLEKPFAYKYPPGLLLVGGIVLLSIPFALRNRSAERRMRALFADEYYRRALAIIDQHQARQDASMAEWEELVQRARLAGQPEPPKPAPPLFDAGFEEAVLSLLREGIARDVAERNLRAMLAYRDAHQE
jgi:hypothetical protein